MNPVKCTCCEREVASVNEIDSVYGVCHPCAFEQSLEHYPCDHGAAEAKPNPLADLWRNEMTGHARSAIRHMFIYDEELAVRLGAEGVRRGADPAEVVKTIEECVELHRSTSARKDG